MTVKRFNCAAIFVPVTNLQILPIGMLSIWGSSFVIGMSQMLPT